MLADDWRRQRALSIARDIEQERAEIPFKRLGAAPVAGVGRVVGHLVALAVAEMAGHLGFPGALDQHLGQLLEQAVFADRVFRFLVVGKRAVRQLDRFRSGLGPLAALCYGHYFSLRAAVPCQTAVYTKLITLHLPANARPRYFNKAPLTYCHRLEYSL
jgi:hypothetical protein